MTIGVSASPYGNVARKWRDLAERRRAHFSELYRSGRWKRYYTEEQFKQRMREVMSAAEAWERLTASPQGHVVAAE